MHKTAIIIVAAGASTRMKAPKQLLPFGKTNLLGNAILQAKSSVANEVLVILGANYNRITSEVEQPGITIIENKNWEKGLGTSISAGVGHLLKSAKNFDAVLISLADQPLINSAYLNRLFKISEENPSQIVATKYPKSNGVPAVFPKKHFALLLELKEDFGAKYLLNSERSSVISIDAGDKILDIDTPEDYRKMKQQK